MPATIFVHIPLTDLFICYLCQLIVGEDIEDPSRYANLQPQLSALSQADLVVDAIGSDFRKSLIGEIAQLQVSPS